MPADVTLTEDARDDFLGFDRSVQRAILKGLLKLRASPELRGRALGSTHGGNLTGFRRLVVGNRDHRIIYKVEEDGTLVVVLVIADRADDECYRLAVSRLRTHGDARLRDLAVSLDELFG